MKFTSYITISLSSDDVIMTSSKMLFTVSAVKKLTVFWLLVSNIKNDSPSRLIDDATSACKMKYFPYFYSTLHQK